MAVDASSLTVGRPGLGWCQVANTTRRLVGNTDRGPEIPGISQLVQHEGSDIRSRNPDGPEPVPDVRALAVMAAAWPIGERLSNEFSAGSSRRPDDKQAHERKTM